MAHNRQHNEGRPSTDVFGNTVVLSGQALEDSNDEIYKKYGLSPKGEDGGTGGAGGYGKKRVGEESRKQMNKTGKRRSSILTTNK